MGKKSPNTTNTIKLAREAAQFLIDQHVEDYMGIDVEVMFDLQGCNVCFFITCPPGIDRGLGIPCRHCPLWTPGVQK